MNFKSATNLLDSFDKDRLMSRGSQRDATIARSRTRGIEMPRAKKKARILFRVRFDGTAAERFFTTNSRVGTLSVESESLESAALQGKTILLY